MKQFILLALAGPVLLTVGLVYLIIRINKLDTWDKFFYFTPSLAEVILLYSVAIFYVWFLYMRLFRGKGKKQPLQDHSVY